VHELSIGARQPGGLARSESLFVKLDRFGRAAAIKWGVTLCMPSGMGFTDFVVMLAPVEY